MSPGPVLTGLTHCSGAKNIRVYPQSSSSELAQVGLPKSHTDGLTRNLFAMGQMYASERRQENSTSYKQVLKKRPVSCQTLCSKTCRRTKSLVSLKVTAFAYSQVWCKEDMCNSMVPAPNSMLVIF
jgi:hypothetical protein